MNYRLLRIAAFALMIAAAAFGAAQEKEAQGSAAPSQQAVAAHSYQLNFVLKETDGGKLLNQRAFTVGVALSSFLRSDSERSSIRAGTRLPIQLEKGTEYIDVGTNLDAYRIWETPQGLQMYVSTEISSVATEPNAKADNAPIRQLKVNASVVAPPGKPTLVFTADDPVSRHQFSLEVTPVRER